MATKITEKVTINAADGDVVFDGVDFTLNGYIEVLSAASVTLKNCRIYGLNVPAKKNYWLKVLNDIPVKIIVEHCFFGEQSVSGNAVYNLLELNAELLTGSSMSYNYLKETAASHNSFNIYGITEGATVQLNGNVNECMTPQVRVGIKGDKGGMIQMHDNSIVAVNPEYDGELADWYGLVCIQPYGKKTTTMSRLVVETADTQLPEGQTQVAYGYSGNSDTLLDESTAPTVIVDGTQIELPIFH